MEYTVSNNCYCPQTFSPSYVNSTSSDEFCLKEGLGEKIVADLLILVLLGHSEVEPTRPFGDS